MITDEQLKLWRELTHAAIGKPWDESQVAVGGGGSAKVVCQFLHSCREAMPALLDEVERLRGWRDGETHFDGCWREHRECAMAEIERLHEENERLILASPLIGEPWPMSDVERLRKERDEARNIARRWHEWSATQDSEWIDDYDLIARWP